MGGKLVNDAALKAALAGLLLAFAIGQGRPPSWLASFLVMAPLLLACALHFLHRKREDAQSGPWKDPSAMLIMAALVASSLALSATPRFFFLSWWPASFAPREIIQSGIFIFFGLTVVLIPLLRSGKPAHAGYVLGALLLGGIGFCFHTLLHETAGAALYRDDHPSFMYRIWALSESLPSAAYYSPFWNAGRVETAAISTGAQALAVLFWPVWQFFTIHDAYTVIVGLVLIVIIPAMAMAGVRLAGGRRMACLAAALLALGTGRFFFIWTLHYGTLPSGFSAAFILPLWGVVIYILRSEHPGAWSAPVLAACLAGIASWPPGILSAIPVALGTLCACMWWTKRKFTLLMLGAACAALLLLPGVLAVFRNVDVGGFVSAHKPAMDWMAEFGKGWKRLLVLMSDSHPLIIFLGVLGSIFLARGPQRRLLLVTIAGLALITGWGLAFKPMLQLNRAGVPLIFVAIIPAALWIEHLLHKPGVVWAPLKAATVALLVSGVLTVASIYRNEWTAPYSTLNDDVQEMAEWIREAAPADSRVMFAGPTVHAYAGGHVAYLAPLTGRAMMACDYYSFSPKLVEYEYPPRSFRENDDAVLAFLDLYNVSAVLTYHEHWKKFFRRHPDRFEETGVFGPNRKRVGFRVIRPAPGWFLQGSGSVSQTINELNIRVDDPNAPVVIRFEWINGFTSDREIIWEPYDAGRGARLIRIHPNGHRDFSLRWSQWKTGHHADSAPGT